MIASRGRGKQQDRLTHHATSSVSPQIKRRDFEREMTEAGSCALQPMARNLARRWARSSSGPSLPQPSSSSIDRALQSADRRFGIAMRAAKRLGDDAVDDAERLQVGGRDLHRFGRIGRLVGRPPQDRRAAFRRNHRIDRMLEHQHAVGGGDGDCAARAALTDDRGDHRHAERKAFLGRAGDRFRLPAFLRLHARKAPGVSTRVTTGMPNWSASRISRIALR